MTFKADWEKTQQDFHISDQTAKIMVEMAFPGQGLVSCELISGGCANLNFKIRMSISDCPFILRVYCRDPMARLREQNLAELIGDKIPIPKVYFTGMAEGYQFSIIEFIDGITLRDLLLGTPIYDLKDIMHQTAVILKKISDIEFQEGGLFNPDLTVKSMPNESEYLRFVDECLQQPSIIQSISLQKRTQIKSLFSQRNHLLANLPAKSLVHGDFDPANILVKQVDGRWIISAILDWEFAFSGTALWDVANMLRYAHQLPVEYQEFFISGLRQAEISLPNNWLGCVYLLNLISLLDLLVRSDLNDHPRRCSDILSLIDYMLGQSHKAKMIKQIKVMPYNPNWLKLFEHEAEQIQSTLGLHCLVIHHIGSTSVPGLAAKEDIDILCVVDDLTASKLLINKGYAFKGEINIPLRYFFSKNTKISKVNLHVTEDNHGFIKLNLCFRDYLRTHDQCRQEYQDLKYELLDDPRSFERVNGQFPGYTLAKNDFIKSVLDQAGYNGLMINLCTHYAEWDAAKSFRELYYSELSVPDPLVEGFDHPDHAHLVLYHGIKIIGYAHIQFLQNKKASLRVFVITREKCGHRFEREFFKIIESWLCAKEIVCVYTQIPSSESAFYTRQGYVEIPFGADDCTDSSEYIALQKTL